MSYLLYKNTTPSKLNTLTNDFSIKNVKPTLFNFIKRAVSLQDIIYNWISLNKCRIYICVDKNSQTVHKSRVVGKNYTYPFLKKNEFEIGPCYTDINYRGLGIYPYVISTILRDNPNSNFYMLVREDNISSIKGIEKAGFINIGTIAKNKSGRWIKE